MKVCNYSAGCQEVQLFANLEISLTKSRFMASNLVKQTKSWTSPEQLQSKNKLPVVGVNSAFPATANGQNPPLPRYKPAAVAYRRRRLPTFLDSL